MKYKTSENHKAIQEICRMADAVGMTYGRYVARYGSGMQSLCKSVAATPMPPNARAVKQMDAQGRVIRCFPSIGKCVRATGMSETAIRRRCNGETTAPCKDGYCYAWAEEEETVSDL